MMWEDLLRAMATLCLTAALAAAAAAAILLVKEDLSDRLGNEFRPGSGRKTGLLTLLAVGVWIMVIGQNVTAAEAGSGSASEIAAVAGRGSTSEIAAETEPGSAAGATEAASTGATETAPAATTEAAPAGATEAPPSGATEAAPAATTGATVAGTNEQAEPVEPEPVDHMAPAVDIQLTEEAFTDEKGNVYCRADNAGLQITFEESGEEDSGLSECRITVTDSKRNELRREVPVDGQPRRITEEIGTEEVAALADGLITVRAEAVDEAGNREEKEFCYILDTTAPVGEILYTSAAAGYVYEGEVFWKDDVEVALRIEDSCADFEMPADADTFGFLMWKDSDPDGVCTNLPLKTMQDDSGNPAYMTGTFRLTSDGGVRFGAYGKDLAGNPLTVKEVFGSAVYVREGTPAGEWTKKNAPFQADTESSGQSTREECLPHTRAVRDTVHPTLTAKISRPSGNPGAVDESTGVVYYGKNKEHYGGGKPQITVSYTVTDQNIDHHRILPLTSYTSVQEGEKGEVIVPEQSITVDPPGDDGMLVIQRTRNPGEESTPDGVYRFGIEGTDKAGNPIVLKSGEEEDELYGVICEDKARGAFYTGRKIVDTVAPEGELQIQNPSGDVYCRMEQHGSAWSTDREDFMPYRREKDAVVSLSSSDVSPVSVSCRILSTAGRYGRQADVRGGRQTDNSNDPAPDGSKYISPCKLRLSIRGAQVFRIENLVFRDRAGNESAPLARTVNLYLDTNLPRADINAPSVFVRTLSAFSSTKADGRPLYADQVTLEVTAEDPDRTLGDSGLSEVRCEVEIGSQVVRSEILFEAGSQAPNPDAEEPPVNKYKGRVTIPSGGQWESNDIEVRVIAVDNAGNRSDPQSGGIFRFGIDTTRPEVTVRYDNNEVRNGMYLNGKRTALITVREQNFDTNALRIDAPGAQIGEWILRRGSTDEWTSEVRFDADGIYSLDISGTDAAGNSASVDYEGVAVKLFVIDRTPPRIEVFWDNKDARNGRYYNRPRRATVRITDVSFDESRVKILPFSKGFHKAGVNSTPLVEAAGVLPSGDGSISTSETVYEMDLPFTEEGEWMLSCACTDLAGNTAVPVSEPAFVLDWTGPRLYFDGETVQENGAYADTLSPELKWEEENPSPGACCAMWSNVSAGGQTMECRSSDSGAIVLPDLPREKPADGICVLSGTACDLAGNRTFIRRNVSVNRFGSLYDLSEDEGTLEMIGNSYTSAGRPFVAAEYNVSALVTRQVTLYRNGAGRVLKENSEYTVTGSSSRSGWKYIYRIDPSAFSEEGRYSLLFESDDAAGRHNSSPGRFREEEIVSPEWVVDRTPPTVRLPDIDTDKKRFTTDAVVISLIPEDNMELTRLTIRITDDHGNLIEENIYDRETLTALLDKSRGEVPVEIRASGKWQTVSAVAEDGAGNQSRGLQCSNNGSEITGYRLLVNSNILVHLYRSGILPAAALLALAAALWVKSKWNQMFTKIL